MDQTFASKLPYFARSQFMESQTSNPVSAGCAPPSRTLSATWHWNFLDSLFRLFSDQLFRVIQSVFEGVERFFVLPPAQRRNCVSQQSSAFRSLDRAAFELRSELVLSQKKQIGDCGVEGDLAGLKSGFQGGSRPANVERADLLTDVATKNTCAICGEGGVKLLRNTPFQLNREVGDRKSTRLNSSHG